MRTCAYCPKPLPWWKLWQRFCSQHCKQHYDDVQAVKEAAAQCEGSQLDFFNPPP